MSVAYKVQSKPFIAARLQPSIVPTSCRLSLRQAVVSGDRHSYRSSWHPNFIQQKFTRAAHRVSMAAKASKTVLVPIANGSEEIEAVTIIDTLRRAGADVTVASVESDLQVTMSRNVKIVADKGIEDVKQDSYDLIALPGGMPGAERLRDSKALISMLEAQQKEDRFVTAICAAPAVVLEAKGFLKSKSATAHPGFADKLTDQSQVNSRVVISGKSITSRGPGTSLEFALTLVKCLYGKEKADEVAGPMVISEGLVY